MANLSGLLGLYWPAREESLEGCSDKAYQTFDTLRALGYEYYYALGRSRKEALKRPFDITPANVQNKLARGRNHRDIPREPIVELGWSMSLWSGGPELDSYKLSIHCGCYSEVVGNGVVLNLPSQGPHRIASDPDRAITAFEKLAAIWSPEQGVLTEGSIDWHNGVLVPDGIALRFLQSR